MKEEGERLSKEILLSLLLYHVKDINGWGGSAGWKNGVKRSEGFYTPPPPIIQGPPPTRPIGSAMLSCLFIYVSKVRKCANPKCDQYVFINLILRDRKQNIAKKLLINIFKSYTRTNIKIYRLVQYIPIHFTVQLFAEKEFGKNLHLTLIYACGTI